MHLIRLCIPDTELYGKGNLLCHAKTCLSVFVIFIPIEGLTVGATPITQNIGVLPSMVVPPGPYPPFSFFFLYDNDKRGFQHDMSHYNSGDCWSSSHWRFAYVDVYLHTKHKVVNELSKSSHYYQILLSPGCTQPLRHKDRRTDPATGSPAVSRTSTCAIGFTAMRHKCFLHS